MELTQEMEDAKTDMLQLLYKELDEVGDFLDDVQIQINLLRAKRDEYMMHEAGIIKQINGLFDPLMQPLHSSH